MKKTVRDIDVNNKKVIVRCDFNVPLDEDGQITDDTRIVGALPTIRYLVENNAKVILMSHMGRPKGEPNPKYSLRPVAEALTKALGKDVMFESVSEVVNDGVKKKSDSLSSGDVMLLENTRFRAEEEANDEGFSKDLASLADIYVNDAFGAAHRMHASTAGIAKFIPAVSGFLIEKELAFLGDALDTPKRPFVAILGGSKVSDKIKVIKSLLEKTDTLLIGGGMAFTFFKTLGYEIGSSILDAESIDLAKDLLDLAKEKNVDMILPVDIKAGKEFNNDTETAFFDADSIEEGWMGLDIGPKTIKLFNEQIASAGTVLWNGPMGVFEMPTFADGTKEVAKALAESNAISIIGGGDSAAAATQFGFADDMSHVSTGGGASLEFIENGYLPCLDLLEDCED